MPNSREPHEGGFVPSGVAAQLDEFAAQCISPTMTAAGFRRRRRTYLLEDDDGSFVVVEFRFSAGDGVTFAIEWAAGPPALRDYFSGNDRKKWPQVRWGLINTSARTPPEFRDHPASNKWQFDPADSRAYGERFVPYLADVLVPRWQAALSRDYQRTARTNDPDFSVWNLSAVFGGVDFTEIILNIDTGDPQDLLRLVERYDSYQPDKDIIMWMRDRIENRPA